LNQRGETVAPTDGDISFFEVPADGQATEIDPGYRFGKLRELVCGRRWCSADLTRGSGTSP